ncbi:MAG: hypothetical protein KBT76_05910 [Sulfitobacter litoralis]|nr:hypothetical protein [Sulfitobacter litoralis]MBQ0801256.1 hypothetical protein [Sulfitobacter litoralis]
MADLKKKAFLGTFDRYSNDKYERSEVDRIEIETELDGVVSRLLAKNVEGYEFALGWQLFPAVGVDIIKIGDASAPYISEADATKLITLASKNCHAFDLAQHVAGMQIAILKATGVDMCPSITMFGAQILNGEKVRPLQRGRPLSSDTHLRVWQFLLCKFLVATTTLRLTRNDASNSSGNFSACDAVADAFCRSNHHTTYAQVKSLCFDKGAKDLRELADYLGLTDGL